MGIKRHVSTELIRPQSSGLCHLVCHSECVYETRVHDIDELRQCLLHVWHGLEQSLIAVSYTHLTLPTNREV